MKDKNQDYTLFTDLFQAFSQSGIEGIKPDNPVMVNLDNMMKKNNQLVYLADVILLDILFISKSVTAIFGIEPDKVSVGYFLTTTHPDDLRRHHLARAKLISVAQELYIQKSGSRIISSNFIGRKPDGSYCDLLYQAKLFYSKVPYESTFLMLVITDISDFKKTFKGIHYYCGEDLSLFRYPDIELLKQGNIFSITEFKIIELIEEGLSSHEISEQLFRSPYTIETHRTNILKKSGKRSIIEVIHDLKIKGLL